LRKLIGGNGVKRRVFAVVFVLLTCLMLAGCGGSDVSQKPVSAEVPPYWTEIARQKNLGDIIVTYMDTNNNIVVVIHGRSPAIIQIK